MTIDDFKVVGTLFSDTQSRDVFEVTGHNEIGKFFNARGHKGNTIFSYSTAFNGLSSNRFNLFTDLPAKGDRYKVFSENCVEINISDVNEGSVVYFWFDADDEDDDSNEMQRLEAFTKIFNKDWKILSRAADRLKKKEKPSVKLSLPKRESMNNHLIDSMALAFNHGFAPINDSKEINMHNEKISILTSSGVKLIMEGTIIKDLRYNEHFAVIEIEKNSITILFFENSGGRRKILSIRELSEFLERYFVVAPESCNLKDGLQIIHKRSGRGQIVRIIRDRIHIHYFQNCQDIHIPIEFFFRDIMTGMIQTNDPQFGEIIGDYNASLADMKPTVKFSKSDIPNHWSGFPHDPIIPGAIRGRRPDHIVLDDFDEDEDNIRKPKPQKAKPGKLKLEKGTVMVKAHLEPNTKTLKFRGNSVDAEVEASVKSKQIYSKSLSVCSFKLPIIRG